MDLTIISDYEREIYNLLDEGGPLAQHEIRFILRKFKGAFGISETNRLISELNLESLGIRKFEPWPIPENELV